MGELEKGKILGGFCGDGGRPREGVAALGTTGCCKGTRGLLCCWEETTRWLLVGEAVRLVVRRSEGREKERVEGEGRASRDLKL